VATQIRTSGTARHGKGFVRPSAPRPSATASNVVRPSVAVGRGNGHSGNGRSNGGHSNGGHSNGQSNGRANGLAGARVNGRINVNASVAVKAAPKVAGKPANGANHSDAEKAEPKILFQKYFHSVGPRTYAAQVKELSNGNHLLVLTEGKRDKATGEVRKIRLFIYGEDFVSFFRLLHETAGYIRGNPVPEEIRRKRAKFWAKREDKSAAE
jgi:Protein of unknown function (DUF3276)